MKAPDSMRLRIKHTQRLTTCRIYCQVLFVTKHLPIHEIAALLLANRAPSSVLSRFCSADVNVGRLLRKQPENAHTADRADINLAVANHGRDELVAPAEIIPPLWPLSRVVEHLQCPRIKGEQHRRIRTGCCPQDRVLAGIGSDAGSNAWIGESQLGLGNRQTQQLCILK